MRSFKSITKKFRKHGNMANMATYQFIQINKKIVFVSGIALITFGGYTIYNQLQELKKMNKRISMEIKHIKADIKLENLKNVNLEKKIEGLEKKIEGLEKSLEPENFLVKVISDIRLVSDDKKKIDNLKKEILKIKFEEFFAYLDNDSNENNDENKSTISNNEKIDESNLEIFLYFAMIPFSLLVLFLL